MSWFMKCYQSYIFRDTMPCSLLKDKQRFGATCRLRPHARRISQAGSKLSEQFASCNMFPGNAG
jgi:hypothetical protein